MARICICFECTSPDEINCVFKNVKEPTEVFPEWLRFSPYYERAVNQESFGPLSKFSSFKHYITLIVHQEDENKNCISCSDVLVGRMAHKILMVDLIGEGKEVELTLSESAQVTLDGSLMTREELCKLWPDYFFLINQKWAILAIKKHWHFKHNSWCALILIQIDSQTGSITPKDSLVYWNDLLDGYFVTAWQNVDVNSIDAPLCGFSVINSVNGDPRFNQIMLSLFVSADLRNQKLNVLKSISEHAINWPDLYISALVGHKLCMFGVELGDLLGRPNSTFVNFHQINISSLNEAEKGFKLKKLKLPYGYEHEFARRCPIAPEMIHVGWSSEHVILCLAAQPPFYNVANTFLLCLSTFTWIKLQIPNSGVILHSNLKQHSSTFHRFQLFSGQALITSSSHVLFDEDSNRSITHRWYRAHVRYPSSLLELAWLRTIHSSRLRSENLKTLRSLLQL